jgi:hypothetical protein
VSEGESPDCTQEAKATDENEADKEATATDDEKPAAEAKPAAKVKSKTERSRRRSTFLQRVDRFLSSRR